MKIGDVVFVNSIEQKVTIREMRIEGALVNWFGDDQELFTKFVAFNDMKKISDKHITLNRDILNLIHKFADETGLSIELRGYAPAVSWYKKGLYLETNVVNS